MGAYKALLKDAPYKARHAGRRRTKRRIKRRPQNAVVQDAALKTPTRSAL